jgi:hypothetical protein
MSEQDENKVAHKPGETTGNDLFVLELCFLLFLLVVVTIAFFEAMTYKIVSSRTPFVIMVPLLILLVVQVVRSVRTSGDQTIKQRAVRAFRGRNTNFRKINALAAWIVALGVTIQIFGHYIGIASFMFLLMWMVAKQRVMTSLVVTLVTTAVIYLLFEQGFNIELYRGMFFRYLAGYRDF